MTRDRRSPRRRPADDAHYQAGRAAAATADARRGPHQATVEAAEPAPPYVLTQTQALTALVGLGVLRSEDGVISWVPPDDTPEADLPLYDSPEPPRAHRLQLQAAGGLIGKLVRHLKWLPTPANRTTIPLEAAERLELERHLPHGHRLTGVPGATVGATGGTVTPE